MANEENGKRLARFLGWSSIGLGLAQIAATRGMAQLIGIKHNNNSRLALRTVGVREIASGLGILTSSRPTGWIWGRVAGDALDLTLLGGALASDNTKRNRVVAATAAIAGITALDLRCGQRLSRKQSAKATGAVSVTKTITVNRSPEELYSFWHDFQNLPRFMRHLESVQVIGNRRSHWKAKAPAGKTVEWDAEIVEDRPNELISWRSVDGAEVSNSGSVRFAPTTGGRGTQVRVEMQYDPPGGKAGVAIAKIFGEEPAQQVEDDLRAFKQVLETGEVVLSDATVQGTHLVQRPAQPPQDWATA
jgi:uncharacterized membrane protein